MPQTFTSICGNVANSILVVYDEDALGLRKGSVAFFVRSPKKAPYPPSALLLRPADKPLRMARCLLATSAEDRVQLFQLTARAIFWTSSPHARVDWNGANDRTLP